MKHTDTRGFTLIELLVVVLIIGILASIAVPQYKMAVHKARIKPYLAVIRELAEAEEVHYMATGSYATIYQREELDISFPAECQVSANGQHMYCGKHITLTTFGESVTDNRMVGVGLGYCYASDQHCDLSRYDIQIMKVVQNVPEGTGLVGRGGIWYGGTVNPNDEFGKKLLRKML